MTGFPLSDSIFLNGISDMISERPSKIINSELFKMDEENLEKKDLKYVRQSMYSERRKLHPAQPKNQAEFHSILYCV
jgi:type IV secretory pathway VirD2 relaxase